LREREWLNSQRGFFQTIKPDGKGTGEGDQLPPKRLRIHETDDRRPAGFVSTFREFSKRGNVTVILFVTKKKSFLSQRPPRRNH
jgi:hypothetical protein